MFSFSHSIICHVAHRLRMSLNLSLLSIQQPTLMHNTFRKILEPGEGSRHTHTHTYRLSLARQTFPSNKIHKYIQRILQHSSTFFGSTFFTCDLKKNSSVFRHQIFFCNYIQRSKLDFNGGNMLQPCGVGKWMNDKSMNARSLSYILGVVVVVVRR